MYKKLVNQDDSCDHFLGSHQDALELRRFDKQQKSDLYIDIFHTIKPDETLQGIALRYNCSVPKLQYYNDLMSDQEFYRLKVLKIPVLRNSILHCQNENEQQNGPRIVDNLIDISSAETVDNRASSVINLGISNFLNQNNGAGSREFLQQLSEDLKVLREESLKRIENSVLPQNSPTNVANEIQVAEQKSSCDGSNFGINIPCIILVVFLLFVLVPLYFTYYVEHHNNSTSQHHHE